MDCNVGHLWIPAFKYLGSLLLPVLMGVVNQVSGKTRETIQEQKKNNQTRQSSPITCAGWSGKETHLLLVTTQNNQPDWSNQAINQPDHSTRDQTIPTSYEIKQSSPDGFVLVCLETWNLLSLKELFWAQSFSPQLKRLRMSLICLIALYFDWH